MQLSCVRDDEEIVRRLYRFLFLKEKLLYTADGKRKQI